MNHKNSTYKIFKDQNNKNISPLLLYKRAFKKISSKQSSKIPNEKSNDTK